MPIRVAFIGCGPRATIMASAYQGNEQVVLSAACDINDERLNAFCDRFGVQNRFTSWERMIEEVSPQILHLATQPTLRKEPILAAAEAKVPVILSEKPIALSLPDLDEMLTACQRSGSRLIVNHQLRYQSVPRRLKSAVERKEIGATSFLCAHCRMNALEQGTHLLDLVVWLKEGSTAAWAWGEAFGTNDFAKTHSAPNTVVGLLGFTDGTRCLTIMGPEAPALYDDDTFSFHFGILCVGTEGRGQMWLGRWHLFRSSLHQSLTRIPYVEDDRNAQRALQNDLIKAVEDVNFLHCCDARIGRKSLEIIEALILSGLEGKKVFLPLPQGVSGLSLMRRQALLGHGQI